MTADRRIACLYLETRSRAQRVAYGWLADTCDIEPVSLESIRDGTATLAEYDACWWHREASLTITEDVSACRPAIEAFLTAGGGLVLTLHALSVVTAWGIETVPPDAAGREELPEPTGYLRSSVYDAHPVFDGFDSLPVWTREPTHDSPFSRYERILPERADVLGCTVRGEDYVTHEAALLSWRVGDGAVIGAGIALGFTDEADHLGNGRRLVGNALSFCADESRWEDTTETTAATASTNEQPGTNTASSHQSTADCVSVRSLERPTSVVATGRPKTAAELGELRAKLSTDPHRPQYHLCPPANWLNDPNGLFEYDGQYHVFYQYNPGGAYHHAIHWGHAVSDDLVHWRDEPVSLTPSVNGPDRDGCWSGCAVDDDGTPTFVYTGGRNRDQLPCLATAADDDLRTWHKHAANPVIEHVPAHPHILETEHWAGEFRDHCVWREDDTWYHLIGAGEQDVGGTVLLYTGETLEDWEYVGPILTGHWEGAGEVWECPELLDLGDLELLHVSNYHDVIYFLGEFDREHGRFDPVADGLLDYGDFYAPQSMDCSDGRTLTWGWLPEARTAKAQWDAGWSGLLSLPREISLGEDRTIRQRPAEELTELRSRRLAEETIHLTAHEPVSIAGGRSLELSLVVDFEDAHAIDLGVLETPAGDERTIIRIDRKAITLDRGRSSRDPATSTETQPMPNDVDDGRCTLRVFVDGSVVEVFANERRCLTSRVYPTLEDATGVSLEADGGDARVAVEVWRLASAWT